MDRRRRISHLANVWNSTSVGFLSGWLLDNGLADDDLTAGLVAEEPSQRNCWPEPIPIAGMDPHRRAEVTFTPEDRGSAAKAHRTAVRRIREAREQLDRRAAERKPDYQPYVHRCAEEPRLAPFKPIWPERLHQLPVEQDPPLVFHTAVARNELARRAAEARRCGIDVWDKFWRGLSILDQGYLNRNSHLWF